MIPSYLYNWISYTIKTTSLYWDMTLVSGLLQTGDESCVATTVVGLHIVWPSNDYFTATRFKVSLPIVRSCQSNENIFRFTCPLWGPSTGFCSHRPGQWGGALMFPSSCTWTNGWANNRDAGDLRRHRAHYDLIVMIYQTVTQEIFDI